jgi:seryl-tRNA synthetase
MHDLRAIRENPEKFEAAMVLRGFDGVTKRILDMDQARRAVISDREEAQARGNSFAKKIGQAFAQGDVQEGARLKEEAAQLKTHIQNMEAIAKVKEQELHDLLMTLPNVPHWNVPVGKNEDDNALIHEVGSAPVFDFDPKEHFEIPGAMPGLDFAAGRDLSGSRFVVLRGAVARVHRALAQMMLDTHIENGFEEVNTPVLVKDDAMFGTGQLPKFADDSYKTTNGWWLIPTSEVTLTNTVAGKILNADELPLRLTAHTQCFRSEAGSAGKDMSGMLRQHQFEKVEMVAITTPDDSEKEQDRMVVAAEGILERLGLAFRTVVLCTGDMGFGAQRTFDIEVWLPGQNTYREISSISTCGDFQARRMNARYKDAQNKPAFVHTLNGSGLAVGRCLIAVLENGQRQDGGIDLPKGLWPWLGGKTEITPDGQLK